MLKAWRRVLNKCSRNFDKMAGATSLFFCALHNLRCLNLIALFDGIAVSNCKSNMLF